MSCEETTGIDESGLAIKIPQINFEVSSLAPEKIFRPNWKGQRIFLRM